jgi:hypothetical protein
MIRRTLSFYCAYFRTFRLQLASNPSLPYRDDNFRLKYVVNNDVIVCSFSFFRNNRPLLTLKQRSILSEEEGSLEPMRLIATFWQKEWKLLQKRRPLQKYLNAEGAC